jgi:hypothetical protein
MKDAIYTCWKALMDNRHKPLRHLELASQAPVRVMSAGSKCVWQLDSEA